MENTCSNSSIKVLFNNYRGSIPPRLAHEDLQQLLRELQIVHDNYSDRKEWPSALRCVARQFNLNDKAVSEAFPGA